MTPEQIRWLTWGAIQHRPHGAPKWDDAGTHKAITDHCGTWGLDVATDHVLAHARDPKARTPFVIKGNKPHNEPTGGPRFPAGKGEECRYHKGEYDGACRSCAADKLAGDTPIPPAAPTPPDVVAARVAELHALRNPPSPDDTDEKETA